MRLTRSARRVTIARLKVDRGELFEAFEALREGLDLPGRVQPDGRVGPSLPPAGR